MAGAVQHDERAALFPEPGPRALWASVALGVVGMGLGVASILFDLGWAPWIVALAALGVAVVCALSGARASVVIGLVAAGAIVASGVVAAGAAPPLPQHWITLPAFSMSDGDDSIQEIGGNDDLIVMMDDEKRALIGYSLDGRPLWTNEQANADRMRTAVLAGDLIVTYVSGVEQGPAIVVNTATGETEWSAELNGAEPFSANDDVIVFYDDDRVFALDRQSGDRVWDLAADVTASSEGASGFNPKRWTANADWIVVRDEERAQFEVLDSRTGEFVTAFAADRLGADWAIVGNTLVTFDYDAHQRIAVGTSLTGGDDWTTEIDGFDASAFYEPVGGALRIASPSIVQWLDGASGDLTTIELPTGWSLAGVYYGIDGARSLVAEHRDPDYDLVGVGVFDTVTGDLTEVRGPFGGGAEVAGVTPAGTLVSLPYLDAVGDEHSRTVLIPDPK